MYFGHVFFNPFCLHQFKTLNLQIHVVPLMPLLFFYGFPLLAPVSSSPTFSKVNSLRLRYIAPLQTCSQAVQLLPGWQHLSLLRNARSWLERKRRGVEKVTILARWMNRLGDLVRFWQEISRIFKAKGLT